MDQNEVDKFFGDLPAQDKKLADVFEEKKEEPKEPVEPTEEKGDDEVRKNRRHRRLEEQLQQERESNIALNERIKTLAEIDQAKSSSSNEPDPRLVRVFGSTDEGKEIARYFGEILEEKTSQAKDEALQEFKREQLQEVQEQKEYESFIDSQLETIDDTYNVDLTSNAPAARKNRREFLELLGNLSPKDDNGNIKDYADFNSTFELYQKTHSDKSETVSRQKEIAARSMQRSGSVDVNKENSDATEQWLNSQGIRTRNK